MAVCKRIKKTDDLVNGETFRFNGDKTLYEVYDDVFYKNYGSKKLGEIIPQNQSVAVFKTIGK